MKGNQNIINGLNELLSYELAAMDQYFIHSQMYLDWGFNKLYERIDHEFDDERGHATKLIERMLFLEGTPDMTKRTGFKVGTDVPEMLESDLRVEYEVDAKLREVIALCEQENDYVTRDMLIVLLDVSPKVHDVVRLSSRSLLIEGQIVISQLSLQLPDLGTQRVQLLVQRVVLLRLTLDLADLQLHVLDLNRQLLQLTLHRVVRHLAFQKAISEQ